MNGILARRAHNSFSAKLEAFMHICAASKMVATVGYDAKYCFYEVKHDRISEHMQQLETLGSQRRPQAVSNPTSFLPRGMLDSYLTEDAD